MNLVNRLMEAIHIERNGKISDINEVLSAICDSVLSDDDRFKISEMLENNYEILRTNFAIPAISVLNQLDQFKAVEVAKLDIERSYNEFRSAASHLHALISTILFAKGLIVSSSAMEAERNMRLAYAIINNLNIIDGDLFIDNADSEKSHDEFVKNLNRKSKNF